MNKNKLLQKLDELGYIYTEHTNSEVRVDRVSIWMGKEKWYDPIQGVRGVGVNSFLKYIMNK